MSLVGLPPRRAIALTEEGAAFIDQRRLPSVKRVVLTRDWREILKAIKSLAIRGAPLIGIAAAFAVVLAARKARGADGRLKLMSAMDELAAARPTAVNLSWAVARMRAVCDAAGDDELPTVLEREAHLIQAEDERSCQAIADNGLPLMGQGARALTVCNTGWLATGGIGTAAGILYRAFDCGRLDRVFACETRPLLQGARLTTFEFSEAGVPVTLLADSAAASLLFSRQVDLCIIGADRIAANGDTANKVGSLQLAVVCRQANIPFYVAAPESTVDRSCPTGDRITIEQRDGREVTDIGGRRSAAAGVEVYNPAFDMVPAQLITAIITDFGAYRPPYHL